MANHNLKNILNPIKIKELVRFWINEDVPSFDMQGLVVGDTPVTAIIYCKQTGILAGFPFVQAVFEELGVDPPKFLYEEGTFINEASQHNKIKIASVHGPARLILLAERTILNVLSRCSGIATKCYNIGVKLREMSWNGRLAATRKTTPGFRMVEKYGVLVGQADTHRYDLSTMIMLKDNHVKISGHANIATIVSEVKKCAGFSCRIEVECSSYDDAHQAAEAGADIIMLDHVSANQGAEISRKLRSEHPSILIEASGNITETNILEYARPEYDIISMSSIIQGCPPVDFSMKIIESN
ncbi:nicotinate-nucleotide pyrophosphorylase [carboxylating]-like [Dermatophagoides pteronyssinus]|uniref:Nicotinate-nucleotide pyrophosphorylase [carboxylating] n=1 Tax=Dermatophagoides pteronyssinus TaxID=6956 RepID=A0A6P6XX87_DERPT|nr:nicotinate-nucleotide pyrophosphorylase [carboxylating]-like [Dermatophagoides pteronyssinus]